MGICGIACVVLRVSDVAGETVFAGTAKGQGVGMAQAGVANVSLRRRTARACCILRKIRNANPAVWAIIVFILGTAFCDRRLAGGCAKADTGCAGLHPLRAAAGRFALKGLLIGISGNGCCEGSITRSPWNNYMIVAGGSGIPACLHACRGTADGCLADNIAFGADARHKLTCRTYHLHVLDAAHMSGIKAGSNLAARTGRGQRRGGGTVGLIARRTKLIGIYIVPRAHIALYLQGR